MIVLDPGEVVEMRLKVKCTGPTKKFGKGFFLVTDKRVLYESDKHGLCFNKSVSDIFIRVSENPKKFKHSVIIEWKEENQKYTFNAEIQKHYGWRPTARDLFDRLDEVWYHDDEFGYDGWRCDRYGVIDNVYMPEYSHRIREGTFSKDMEECIEHEKFKEFLNKIDTKINKSKIKKSISYCISKLYHEVKEANLVAEMEGKTYEEQRIFRRHAEYRAHSADYNYHFSYGFVTPERARGTMEDLHMKCAKIELEFYNGMVQKAEEEIKAHRNNKKWLNERRDYSAHAAQLDVLYGYYQGLMWINESSDDHASYVKEPLMFTGTAQEFLDRMKEQYKVRKRIYDIIEKEYPKFDVLRNFFFRVYELYDILLTRLRDGEDIDSYVPPTKFVPAMKKARMEIAEFEKRLQEP